MPLIWKLVAISLAGIYDLVFGVFVTVLFGLIFDVPLNFGHYIIGAMLGALPDIDLLIPFIAGTKEEGANKHREYITHRPVVGIPTAIFLGWFWGGEFWGWVAGTSVFFHYIHDTGGWLGFDNGITWFWPLSSKYWGFNGSKTLTQVVAEMETFDKVYPRYLKPENKAVAELAIAVILFGASTWIEFGEDASIITSFIFILGLMALWSIRLPIPE